MDTMVSQEQNDIYPDECVDAGAKVNVSAWDAILVFMHALDEKTGRNFKLDILGMEDLFLLVINEIFSCYYDFDPCDSDLLKRIIKDMYEMGYLDKYEKPDASVYSLNEFSTRMAEGIVDNIPGELHEITVEIVEILYSELIGRLKSELGSLVIDEIRAVSSESKLVFEVVVPEFIVARGFLIGNLLNAIQTKFIKIRGTQLHSEST